ncbi:hypothetical protein COCSADRAFT_307829 [Bipolaris sorokiniana ND90Pr]|uniref:Uncharacterized protein n=1 Tax=Cochliobolus sativus (strain ND90Pr / ATCC 201652) TaxID=665912 RepID=M2SEE3_COCSN|nr:uncharacterized protein COCSADRAFT_307829 [Bipolaris sorokiniana ND90Pr]EMD65618.1 hypothetical protein COCSADRAFT_307829 [Bipolaris sorokiniana ND90Pr]
MPRDALQHATPGLTRNPPLGFNRAVTVPPLDTNCTVHVESVSSFISGVGPSNVGAFFSCLCSLPFFANFFSKIRKSFL